MTEPMPTCGPFVWQSQLMSMPKLNLQARLTRITLHVACGCVCVVAIPSGATVEWNTGGCHKTKPCHLTRSYRRWALRIARWEQRRADLHRGS